LWTENIVSGIARDLLAGHDQDRSRRPPIVLHVHDGSCARCRSASAARMNSSS
jgi:hypothetical protein